MSLTPISIRGKRKTPWTQPPKVFNKPQKVRKTVAEVRAARGGALRPSLESLPPEILEQILLYSSSTSLPRASHIIGRKLSHASTRVRFVVWAFHDTWDQWFGIPADRSLCHGPWPEGIKGPQDIACAGDHELQSQVLELSWVTIDFLLQAQQTWARKYARHRWHEHVLPWVDVDDDGGHDHKGGFDHFDARECFEADYQQALDGPMFDRPVQWAGNDVHPLTRIPPRLVTGPWNDEQQRRLFWLIRGGVALKMGKHHAVPWEMKLDALRNSVLAEPEPNLLIFNCLRGADPNEVWMFSGLPQDVIRQEVMVLQKRLDWGAESTQGMSILRMAWLWLSMHLDVPADMLAMSQT
jgi:hypothetical protein